MRHLRQFVLIVFILLAALASAQSPPPPFTTSQLILPISTQLAPVTSAAVTVVGNPGPQTYCYWAVANYLVGATSPNLLTCITSAPNTLSSGNYIQIIPTYPNGALVDILRTTAPIPPGGTCNCAVATSVASGAINDQSASLLGYTVTPFTPGNFVLTIANEVTASGATHAILRQNGAFVSDLSLAGTGTLTGSGATGTIPIWSGTSTNLGNSPLTVSGGTVNVADNINVVGTDTATQFIGQGAFLASSGLPASNFTPSLTGLSEFAIQSDGSLQFSQGNNTSSASAPFAQVGTASSFFAYPNGVMVAGVATIYKGSDICLAMSSALTNNANGGFFNAMGFTGTQVCPPSSMTTLAAAIAAEAGTATVQLGCPLYWYVPLQSSAASDGINPLQAMIVLPQSFKIYGCGTSGAPGALTTNIIACTGLNTPVTGCTAPQTHQFTVSSTAVSHAGNRTYLQITGTGMDIVPREPVRLDGSTTTPANNAALTICQNTTVVAGYTDTSCPANPTSTNVYAPINSGIVSLTISGGTAYTTPSIKFTGGGCAEEPTAVLAAGTGPTLTGVQNRGYGCTSAPTGTITDLSGTGTGAAATATIETGCTPGTCGVLYAELPMFETGPKAGASFSEVISGVVINCSQLVSCVPLRSLTGQEHTDFSGNFLTGVVERGFDFHTSRNQNMNTVRALRVTPGISPTCDSTMEGGYIGDVGPHGLEDYTADFSQCGTNYLTDGIRVDSVAYLLMTRGHTEKALYGVLIGESAPSRNIHIDTLLGAPTVGITLTNGPYQNENSTAIKVRPEYYSTSVQGTTDYIFANIGRNNSSTITGTVADDSPVNVGGTSGYWIVDNVTSLYAVDLGANGCSTALTSSALGSNLGCGAAIGAALGSNYDGQFVGSTATTAAFTQNKATLYSFNLRGSVTGVNHIIFDVAVADNTANLYDIGVFGPCDPNFPSTQTCPLVANIGPTAGTTFAPATGMRGGAIALTQGTVNFAPGRYYLAITTNCSTSCASLLAGANILGVLEGNATITTSGGSLSIGTFVAPADNVGTNAVPLFLLRGSL